MLLAAIAAAARAQPSECASCHPSEVQKHGATRHARALRPAATSNFAQALPVAPLGEARGGFLLSYERKGAALEVTAVRDGATPASAMIEWVFGAGDQGVTPVARIGQRWFEHRISYYPRRDRFDLTLGHQPGLSKSAEAAIGIEQPPLAIRNCFGCHATVSTDLEVKRAGVECVRCHAGAAEHARGKGLPVNPSKLSPAAQLGICAECHRPTPPTGNANDPLNIRFQLMRLVSSKCYRAGKLVCTTCHPAHEDARKVDAAFYRAKCLQCHASAHRSKEDCTGCHMPKSSPAPYLSFSDHLIR